MAAGRHLGVRQTARLLALAHAAGADSMVACFGAKYHFLAWRPVHAIPRAGTDPCRPLIGSISHPLGAISPARSCLDARAARRARLDGKHGQDDPRLGW